LKDAISSKNTLVLFPGPQATNIADYAQNTEEHLQSFNLILIDGTWSQARTIYNATTFLHSLPQVNILVHVAGFHSFLCHCAVMTVV